MKILYFAWLRTEIGMSEETATPPATIKTAGELIDWLAALSPRHGTAFEKRDSIRVAINQEFAETDSALAGATEVAFFPPVTGG